MKKSVTVLLVVVGIVMIPVAFLAGLYRARKAAERVIQSEADFLIYYSSVCDAQHYGELLLYARQGNTNELVRGLEYFADTSLLMAASKTNATIKVWPKGPWIELRADRSTYPRGRSPQAETRISSLLDELIREEPKLNPADVSQPFGGVKEH